MADADGYGRPLDILPFEDERTTADALVDGLILGAAYTDRALTALHGVGNAVVNHFRAVGRGLSEPTGNMENIEAEAKAVDRTLVVASALVGIGVGLGIQHAIRNRWSSSGEG